PTATGSTTMSVPLTTAATDVGSFGTGIASYALERATAAAGPFTVISAAATFPYSDSGLTASTTYYFRAKATDLSGNVGTYSAIVNGTTSAAAGIDFYISTTGSDSNPGTQGSPWAITAINTKRATYAGKTVGLLDGTYDLSSLVAGSDYDRPILQVATGTVTNQTVVKAVNARQATLYGGASLPTTTAAAIGQGASGAGNAQGGYFTVDGLVIDHFYALGLCGWFGGSANIPGIVFQNCEVKNIANQSTSEGNNCGAIRFQGVNGASVINCYLHDIFGGNASENEGYGVLSFNSNHIVCEYNTIKLCEHGIYHKQTAQGAHTARYNYIDVRGKSGGATPLHEWNGTGFTPTEANEIYNNILVGTDDWDLKDFGTPGSRPMRFRFNSVYAPSGTHGIFMPRTSGTVDVFGNIFAIAAGVTVSFDGELHRTRESMSGHTNDYNCWSAAASSTARIGLSNLSSYASVTKFTLPQVQGEGFETHSIASAPGFTVSNPTTPAEFQLSSGSACKNAARSDGTTGGSICDMGAWGSATPPTRIGCDFA